jgi:hypothetical protein
MLNFDMVGSPNFVRFVYDGDLSDSEPPEGGAPAASADDRAAVPRLLREPGAPDGADGVRRPLGLRAVHLRRHPGGAACSPAPRCSRTPEEAAIYGGTAGEPYDPCYHMGCDTIDNLDATRSTR